MFKIITQKNIPILAGALIVYAQYSGHIIHFSACTSLSQNHIIDSSFTILYNNPMATEQSVLLKLIRQSQFDTVEDIAWDDIDLDALYEDAKQQTVLGLIASLIPEKHSNDTWRKAQFRQGASYIRYRSTQGSVKEFYPPNHRIVSLHTPQPHIAS